FLPGVARSILRFLNINLFLNIHQSTQFGEQCPPYLSQYEEEGGGQCPPPFVLESLRELRIQFEWEPEALVGIPCETLGTRNTEGGGHCPPPFVFLGYSKVEPQEDSLRK
ncbi:MAG: hypothetical protein VKL39_23550, partial [Leptolyngbyaceae bacterium]|nr:hypothetical protein [Leptolyngbyaceae bacterium]